MSLFTRLLCAIAFTLAVRVASAAAATIAEFPVLTSGRWPVNIAAAPRRGLRFSEAALQKLAQLLASQHLLLFGGGFTREALVEFCRAELRACGGNA